MVLTDEQFSYIKYIDSLTNKELTEICRAEKVKLTSHGVSNKYVKKINILSKYMGYDISRTIWDNLLSTF
tara:strand:+ start:927 stop:1136 length:210 start_codon:yes stop_codon:yes gene_type:complete